PLSFAVIDLCLSPKSKSAYTSIKKAMDSIRNNPQEVPVYLRLTPTNLKESEKYPYDREDLWNKIQYLPDKISGETFYEYSLSGKYEKALVNNYLQLRKNIRSNNLEKLKNSNK
ncbi:TPA: replication-associated recombination protein A, partial [bacterium]|nr:replication-associated recombination protein A [bacterium]